MTMNFVATRVRAADPGDAARADAYAADHPQGSVFHRSAWGEAVAAGCGQRAHLLVAERGRAIVGMVPLTEIHSPLFGRALVSSGFAIGGGILADDETTGEALAGAAWELAARLSCSGVELRGGHLPAGWTRDGETYLGFARPLAADDERALLAIPRKQRAEVRRALGFDLTVEVGRARRDRDAHYAVYAESVRNLGTPVFPRRLFAEVLDGLGDDADILTVRREGRAIASVLSLYDRGTAMPFWGGGTAAARTWRANDLMYFALMRHARARGCAMFDFGRSKAGTGAAAFKRNWGFEGRALAYASRTADGAAPRSINPLSPRYRMQVALWRRLPGAIADRLGPGIARGLG